MRIIMAILVLIPRTASGNSLAPPPPVAAGAAGVLAVDKESAEWEMPEDLREVWEERVRLMPWKGARAPTP